VHDVVNSDGVLAYCSTNPEHTLNSIQTRATSVYHSRWTGKRTAHRFRQSAAEFGQQEDPVTEKQLPWFREQSNSDIIWKTSRSV
jgi:hypothetical protein